MTKGRTKGGKLRKGYRLTKCGRVAKAKRKRARKRR